MNLKKEYFYLNRESILIGGEKGAAIHNLYTGQVFSCAIQIARFLNHCENSALSIDAILEKHDDFDESEIMAELASLQKLGLGDFYENRVIVEKMRPPFQKQRNRDSHKPPVLSQLTIELTNECNLDCLFCSGQNHNITRCGCWRHNQKSAIEKLSLPDWIKIIENALLFHCNSIKIIGGEPFIESNVLLKLVDVLHRKRIKSVEICTNGALLMKEFISQLPDNVKIVVPFYSSDKEIHERMTGEKNSFEKIVSHIKNALDAKVRIAINLIVHEINCNRIDDTSEFLRNLGIKHLFKSYANMELFKAKHTSELPFLRETRKYDFFRNIKGHSCWDGNLAITCDGDVLPCIMARGFKIANIRDKSLREILRGKDYQVYWDLSKDKIEVCQNCEFRFACFDCRLLQTTNGNLYEKNIYCDYKKEKVTHE